MVHNSLDGFQNLDKDEDWKTHDPIFEWDYEELVAFEQERQQFEQEMIAMVGWWEIDGVRCATFGRDPNRNPYQ